MTDRELIKQLKALKSVNPNNEWVVSARKNLVESEETQGVGIYNLFNFIIPRPMAMSLLVAIVFVVGGGIAVFQEGFDTGNFVASVRHKSLSTETKKELKEIADYAESYASFAGTTPTDGQKSDAYTVIFKENSDEQEVFKKALRDKIEAKIAKIEDSFAQLEDGDLAREISLNQRRYEENFKLADEEIASQVKSLLEDAQTALANGNLIDALDLVVAIDKLLD